MDTRLDKIVTYGTAAARAGFTPDPAPNILVVYYETDTGDTYVWDGAWHIMSGGGGGSGITALTGDVTAGPGSGSQAATIANEAVTYAKIQDVAFQTLLGRNSTGSGVVQEVPLTTALNWLGAAEGELLIHNGTAVQPFTAGADGYVLTGQGPGAMPIWSPLDTAVGFAGDMSKWDAAKARGSSNPARFLMIGDSNIAGQGSAGGTFGLDGAVLTSMARRFASNAGFQIESFFGEQNITLAPVALGTYDTRITLGSGWAPDSIVPQIVGGRFLRAPGGSVGKLRFTPSTSVSSFRYWYPTTAGLNGAVTVSIDGVLVDTFSQNAANSLQFRDYSVTPGAHYIEIGGGATGYTYVSAIETFDGSDTPVFLQGGYCAGKAVDFDYAVNPWNSRPETVALAPDFTLIYSTINDATNSTTVSDYYTYIQDLVSYIAPTSNGCLTVGWPGNTNSNFIGGLYDDYARALQNIARDYNWSYFDFRSVWGHSFVRADNLGYAFDTVHPNLSGAQVGGDAIFAFLSSIGL